MSVNFWYPPYKGLCFFFLRLKIVVHVCSCFILVFCVFFFFFEMLDELPLKIKKQGMDYLDKISATLPPEQRYGFWDFMLVEISEKWKKEAKLNLFHSCAGKVYRVLQQEMNYSSSSSFSSVSPHARLMGFYLSELEALQAKERLQCEMPWPILEDEEETTTKENMCKFYSYHVEVLIYANVEEFPNLQDICH